MKSMLTLLNVKLNHEERERANEMAGELEEYNLEEIAHMLVALQYFLEDAQTNPQR